jgi:ribosome maturation factor RimP
MKQVGLPTFFIGMNMVVLLPVEQRVVDIVGETLTRMGYRLVRAKYQQEDKRNTLQIMIECLDETSVTVEDCTKVSHHVSALLDVEDPVTEAYHLEVSSPGMDRPLMTKEDFERFSGYQVVLTTQDPQDETNRRRFKGKLCWMGTGEEVCLQVKDEEDAVIRWDNIASAKLVITNALMEETLKKSKTE